LSSVSGTRNDLHAALDFSPIFAVYRQTVQVAWYDRG